MKPKRTYTILESLLFPKRSLDIEKIKRDFQGKTILITGASYGIGKELAETKPDLKISSVILSTFIIFEHQE